MSYILFDVIRQHRERICRNSLL